MREIKFRAWDKKIKKMFNYDLVMSNYACHEQLPYPTLVGIGNPTEEIINNPSDLMQFTGLLDKNGKEIYEGDIVKCKFAFGNNVCEVVEEKGCYWVSQKNKEIKDKAHDNLYWHIDGIEVLGNIYEHPHLLESGE